MKQNRESSTTIQIEKNIKKQTQQNPQARPLISQRTQQNNCGCKSHKNEPYIGNYHEAPQWMRYQELTIGYRINFYSFKLIFKSLFMLHNQTTNVWTHLFGAFLLIFTAVLTGTKYIDLLYESAHVHIETYQQPHPLGSGMSFLQNITESCFNEEFLSHNENSQYSLNFDDQLAYDVCQSKANRHECYMKKSHERKLRNWLEFNLGIPFDNLEEMKLKMEKQIVPNFVHQVENQMSNKGHDMIDYIAHYFHLYESLNNHKTESEFSHRQAEVTSDQEIQKSSSQTELAKWPLVFYLICNSICLLCSVSYHLFYPLSEKAHSLCVCTDFAGISVLFGGSAIPCIYYGMYCYFEVAQAYLTGIISASILVFLLSFTNKFQDRRNSTFRVIVYFLFACFMVTPLFHMSINELIFNNYNDSFSLLNSLPWYALGLICFGIGGFFYASQMPNCFSKTGKYDYFGHSHHYWHICVVMAIVTIYVGCVQNYFTRRDAVCAASF